MSREVALFLFGCIVGAGALTLLSLLGSIIFRRFK